MLEPKVRRDRQSSRNPVYLVRGTLKCGLCGASMTSASTFRDGRLYRYYRCSTRDKQGKAVCPTVQMPAEAIERYVVDHVQRRLQEADVWLALSPSLERWGLCQAAAHLDSIWDALTLANQQRLIRLLVEEVCIDQRVGRLSIRLRDLAALEEAAC